MAFGGADGGPVELFAVGTRGEGRGEGPVVVGAAEMGSRETGTRPEGDEGLGASTEVVKRGLGEGAFAVFETVTEGIAEREGIEDFGRVGREVGTAGAVGADDKVILFSIKRALSLQKTP